MNMIAPHRSERIPASVRRLGSAGLIPFVIGAILAWAVPTLIGMPVGRLVLVYGAVILSFVGGMHWGLASAKLAYDPDDSDAPALFAPSVMPSLVGCGAVFMPDPLGLLTLAVAFALVLIADRWAGSRSLAPLWWMKLRLRLSLVVIASLLVTAAAAARG